MMPNATTPPAHESARQILGKAIKFFRTERGFTQRDLANRVGCSPSDIDDWEHGRSAPPDHRWGRLCKMLHDDLSHMRATWQRARAENEQEKAERERMTGNLTTKPFANITALVKPPALAIVPAPAPSARTPETLHDDGFDLRPAYRAVAKLPRGWRSAEATAQRRAYALELIEHGLNDDDVYRQVRLKYGVGIVLPVLLELRAELHERKVREHAFLKARLRESVEATPIAVEEQPAMPESAPPAPASAPAENNIEGAVRLILEAIPNLKSFKIEVSNDGEIDVSHTTREVKVVETTGSLKLKR